MKNLSSWLITIFIVMFWVFRIIVAITGTVMTMPGLPLHPAAERIDVDDNGVITGLS